ncbi:MAG: hypothetical protein R3Y12_04920 [Clostridia bacterium]
MKIVKKVILGEKYAEKLHKPLNLRGIECVFLPKNKEIEWQINSHADIQIFNVKDDIFVCEPSISVNFNVIYGKTHLKKGYPNNIAYNSLLIGNKFFHNLKYTDEQILKNLENVTLHNVKQGFARCSTLILGENIAITADKGMYKALKIAKIDVLLINEGEILLDGYDYGFIGGCGFMQNDEKLCLTGTLEHHSSFNEIHEFLFNRNIQIDYLTNEKIFDVGSILPIFN